ncbi:unnamed protein product [Urochloa humidicola]
MLRAEAVAEIDKLKFTVDVLAGPSAPAPETVFPHDSPDDINAQSLPLRLSQEEREFCSQDFNNFQMMIFIHVGHRLKKKPKKLISSFKIAGYRPRVPAEKALAMRNKIASDENLKQTTLIDFGAMVYFDGADLLATFGDHKNGEAPLLDYIVHCLRYNDTLYTSNIRLDTGCFLTLGCGVRPSKLRSNTWLME